MKKRVLTLLAAATLFALIFCVSAFASDAVVITTAEELTSIMQDSEKWSGDYKLGADINMSGHTQRAIGSYSVPFSGTFDGDGHTVKGLNIRTSGAAGLFGVVSGTVKNITVDGAVTNTFDASSAETKIEGKYPGTGGIAGVLLSGAVLENCTNYAEITGPGNCGGVVGVVYNFSYDTVTVTNCKNYGTLYSSAGNCGGVFGRIYVSTAAYPAVTVKGCENHAAQTLSVDNRNRLGGIVGYVRSEAGVVIIEDCKNTADITAENVGEAVSNDYPYAGGVVARIEAVSDQSSAVRVLKCANSGKVTSGKYAGGVVTYIQRADVATENVTDISECINTGAVTAPRFVGGIIAYTENKCAAATYSGVYNSANYGTVTGEYCGAGICGRQYGFFVENCYSAGTVSGTTNTGSLVGMAEGAIYCETDACYYLDTSHAKAVGKSGTLCIELAKVPVSAEQAKNASAFSELDFENIWTIGENGPTLKMLTGESNSSGLVGKDDEPKSPFVQTRTYEGQFTDVTEDKWFHKYVKTAYEYALANGTSANKFSPDNKFTVAQALTAAANIHCVYYGKTVRAAYTGENWYDPYVSYCIDNGIIRYGMFTDYNKNITRGEMAIVFASILPDSEYAQTRTGSNPDVTSDMTCYSAVQKLYNAGIVGGDAGTGNYRPNDEIVRSEACVIFTRIALADERIK
ncbi:MAG: S-layer homology domain-containing protein [Clostridia bacterium]|nr:S-layer homology domain-containing protein [Clostridia bacterium]